MHRPLGMVTLAWLLALAACGAPDRNPAAPPLARVGTGSFSIEMPPGRGWQVERSEFSLTLVRRASSWSRVTEEVRICVSKHPLAAGARPTPEQDLAREFLDSEEMLLWAEEGEEAVSSASRQELSRNGRRLFELAYSAQSIRRAPSAAGSVGDWIRTAEVYVQFPGGVQDPSFFSFEIRETHRLGAQAPEGILRLIDAVIDGFRVEEPRARLGT